MSKDGPVFEKYQVTRTDGSDGPGGKHEGDSYFVLDITTDPYALPALRAYAVACAKTHPELANDLLRLVIEREDVRPDITMVAVESSNVQRVGYDAVSQVLRVEFFDAKRGTRIYDYSDVPPQGYKELMEAESVGSFLNRMIKPYNSYTEVVTDVE
jgi:hypothetical protein